MPSPTVPEPSAGRPTAHGSRLRDRRGRGLRGPAFLPGPLAPQGVPAARSPRARFDAIALMVFDEVQSRWEDRLGRLELAVEEIPVLPASWASEQVPLAAYVAETPATPPRLVLFRQPIEHRAETRLDLEALLLTVVVEQFADLLGVAPEDVHPDYQDE